ncbi:LppX_LprAFG lipoprotein [Mycolicibacterium poriferae]|jgi:lipoprotein LprG|uniref:Lipoarabinomannan carrier protein LprG n=2 Tax=Mycolicibacterium poriferae TaxID=39694 RepID=A0A6N4V8Q8_9MYCO|nr:Lipoprotein LprG precursor [Mycobacterium sp. THAF192]BBX51986.1 lipoarabinomannan carrier protein LprG [Mycolicibacterium poriferae]
MQDMQTRLLAILAALFAVAALVAGCSGSSDDSATDLPDAATLLQESSETTAGETSAHLKLAVQGQIAELPVESLEGDLTQRPAVAAKGTADIVFLGQRLQGVQFVVADGDLYAAITAGGSLSNFGPASDIYDVAAILSPDAGLANVLSNFSDAKSDGRETVEGVTTVRITGMVSADAVNKIAPQIAATAPVPGTAWVAEDGDHQLMQARLEPSPGNSVTMTLSDWGEPVTVDKPAV